MAKYVYPAIFTPETNGQYSVRFPDINECVTCGDSLPEAIEMAQDALALMLSSFEDDSVEISPASALNSVVHEANEIVSLINCDTIEYRRLYQSRAIKKTLTIPAWLNAVAKKNSINFSQVLQEALVQRLGL